MLSLLVAVGTGVEAAFSSDQLAEMLRILNGQRARQGLKPLCINSKLQRIAQEHSDNQARQRKMSHDLPGSTFNQRTRASGYNGGGQAENVAMTSYLNLQSVNDMWWNSPGHRNNIVGDYTHVGIGHGKASDGSNYFTQNFGKSSSEKCDGGGNAGETPAPAPKPEPPAPKPQPPTTDNKNRSRPTQPTGTTQLTGTTQPTGPVQPTGPTQPNNNLDLQMLEQLIRMILRFLMGDKTTTGTTTTTTTTGTNQTAPPQPLEDIPSGGAGIPKKPCPTPKARSQ